MKKDKEEVCDKCIIPSIGGFQTYHKNNCSCECHSPEPSCGNCGHINGFHLIDCIAQKPSGVEEWETKFDKEVPGYSMNEYSNNGDKIRPIMVQREDVLKFIKFLQKQKELEIGGEIWLKGYNSGCEDERNVIIEEVEKYIEENRHKVERIDRYVLDNLIALLKK